MSKSNLEKARGLYKKNVRGIAREDKEIDRAVTFDEDNPPWWFENPDADQFSRIVLFSYFSILRQCGWNYEDMAKTSGASHQAVRNWWESAGEVVDGEPTERAVAAEMKIDETITKMLDKAGGWTVARSLDETETRASKHAVAMHNVGIHNWCDHSKKEATK